MPPGGPALGGPLVGRSRMPPPRPPMPPMPPMPELAPMLRPGGPMPGWPPPMPPSMRLRPPRPAGGPPNGPPSPPRPPGSPGGSLRPLRDLFFPERLERPSFSPPGAPMPFMPIAMPPARPIPMGGPCMPGGPMGGGGPGGGITTAGAPSYMEPPREVGGAPPTASYIPAIPGGTPGGGMGARLPGGGAGGGAGAPMGIALPTGRWVGWPAPMLPPTACNDADGGSERGTDIEGMPGGEGPPMKPSEGVGAGGAGGAGGASNEPGGSMPANGAAGAPAVSVAPPEIVSCCGRSLARLASMPGSAADVLECRAPLSDSGSGTAPASMNISPPSIALTAAGAPSKPRSERI
mmetsp:Transcript_40125/g.106126  ORF Transcript_40125/g.106126 Transcript_40125/m.106126 type:complete len:349 (+) Transcript_40125:1137-2183(+)